MGIIYDKSVLFDRSDEVNLSEERAFAKKIISELKKEMKEHNWASLSAPQIGYQKRIFCVNFSGDIQEFINPMITNAGGLQFVKEQSTCIPDKLFLVPRNTSIAVSYQTLLDNETNKKFIGAASYVVQQNINTLDGILIDDIGMEIDEGYDTLTDDEKAELLHLYREHITEMREKADAEVKKDEYASRLSDAIAFNTARAKGEIEFERTQ